MLGWKYMDGVWPHILGPRPEKINQELQSISHSYVVCGQGPEMRPGRTALKWFTLLPIEVW